MMGPKVRRRGSVNGLQAIWKVLTLMGIKERGGGGFGWRQPLNYQELYGAVKSFSF